MRRMIHSSLSPSRIGRSVGLAAVGFGVIVALWIANMMADRVGGWAPHAASHLSAAIVAAMLTATAVGLRGLQRAHFSRGGRLGPLMFVAGSAWFVASQLVESLSAVIEYPNSGIVHSASGMASMLGMLIALAGLLLTVFASVTGGKPPSKAMLVLMTLGAFVFSIFISVVVFGVG